MLIHASFTFGKPMVSQASVHGSFGTYVSPRPIWPRVYRRAVWDRGGWNGVARDFRWLWFSLTWGPLARADQPDEARAYGRATCACCQGVGWHLTAKDGSPPLVDSLGDGRYANLCLSREDR